jgi:hypothetical protein
MLRDRRLLALLVAETVSTTGAQMTWLALPWFAAMTLVSVLSFRARSARRGEALAAV